MVSRTSTTVLALLIGLAIPIAIVTVIWRGGGEDTEAATEPETALATQEIELPPSGDGALAHLEASPRHGEWVVYDTGDGDSVTAWLVYPERSERAPVVVVIHEIFGLTDWIRAVADQLAAEGFIAIAPDLLSGKGPEGGGSVGLGRDQAVRLIRGLERDEIVRRLNGTVAYATALPAARADYGVIGFCWGGSTSFAYATAQPGLSAAVVYYGSSPSREALGNVETPVLGLYGGDDERVTATIPRADSVLGPPDGPYEREVYDGAGHGFLRAQDGRDGANLRATRQAWPRTIRFLRSGLGR